MFLPMYRRYSSSWAKKTGVCNAAYTFFIDIDIVSDPMLVKTALRGNEECSK